MKKLKDLKKWCESMTKMDEQQLKKYFDEKYADIDLFLISNGVSKQHVDLIKNEKIKSYIYPEICYDEVEAIENVLVPVENIVNTTRSGVINREWYQIVKESFLTFTSYKQANIEPKRILNCFIYLSDLGWEKWNKSFLDKKVANFNFYSYENQDGTNIEYHQQGGNGGWTHRLIAAKVGGVENILSNKVYRHVFNPYKYDLYIKIKNYENKVRYKIQESIYFKLDNEKQSLVCECVDPYYNYNLGIIFKDIYDTSYKNDIKYVESYLLTLQKAYKILNDIEANLMQRINCYMWFPTFLIKRKIGRNNFINLQMLIECIDDDLEEFVYEVVKEVQLITSYNEKVQHKIK